MAEYIERYALIRALRGTAVARYPASFYMGLFAAADEASKFPAADVVERKRGKWISLTDCSNAGVYCSECHKKVWKEDYAWCNRKNKLRSNFCPNCGADMRKEDDSDAVD